MQVTDSKQIKKQTVLIGKMNHIYVLAVPIQLINLLTNFHENSHISILASILVVCCVSKHLLKKTTLKTSFIHLQISSYFKTYFKRFT